MLNGTIEFDPELRFTPSGKALCQLNLLIAADDGNRTIYCIAWEGLGEQIANAYHRGDNVYLTGYWKTRKWTGRDGKKHSRQEFTIQRITL